MFEGEIYMCNDGMSSMEPKGEILHTSLAGESIEEQEVRLAWFRDAKFGMFIHWGPASLLGVELSWDRSAPKPFDITGAKDRGEDPEYDSQFKQFNPVKFDASQWVEIAKDAGMKYLVIVTKHHDGFSNFHTKYSDYNIANTPFKRDIVKELADACHSAGMKFGVYYSQRDWYHPAYLIGDNNEYREFMKNQIRELLTNYGKVDIIWFDSYGTRDLNDCKVHDELWKPQELLEMMHELQPGIIVNNRLAILASYNHPDNIGLWCDYDTPEEKIGNYQYGRAWESCMTLVGGQWSYKPGGKMYTREECIRMLVNTVTGDGNLLLNIGPMPTGEIEGRQIDRLKEIGEWLKIYGESIYCTRGGPFVNGDWGRSTRRGNTVYIHAMNRNGDSLTLPKTSVRIGSAELLAGGKVEVIESNDEIQLMMPRKHQQEIDTVIKCAVLGGADLLSVRPPAGSD